MTEFFGECAQVFNEILDLILIDLGGFCRKIVAAHVRSDCLIVAPELSELILPFVPELREAVNKHNQLSFARRHIVQTYSIHFRIFVFEHRCFRFLHVVFVFAYRLWLSVGANE